MSLLAAHVAPVVGNSHCRWLWTTDWGSAAWMCGHTRVRVEDQDRTELLNGWTRVVPWVCSTLAATC